MCIHVQECMHVSLCVPMSQWEHLQGQPGVYTSAMDTRLRVPKPQKYISRQAGYCQELMSRPKGGNERPTSHYSVQQHLTLNDCHTFLLWNYSQVGSFPLWSLREGVRHVCFHLMLDVDAGIDDSRPR